MRKIIHFCYCALPIKPFGLACILLHSHLQGSTSLFNAIHVSLNATTCVSSSVSLQQQQPIASSMPSSGNDTYQEGRKDRVQSPALSYSTVCLNASTTTNHHCPFRIHNFQPFSAHISFPQLSSVSPTVIPLLLDCWRQGGLVSHHISQAVAATDVQPQQSLARLLRMDESLAERRVLALNFPDVIRFRISCLMKTTTGGLVLWVLSVDIREALHH